MLTRSEVAIDRGLLRQLSEARHETDRLFGIAKQGSLYDRPIPERHRIVFYIGHLEAFDWNLLRETLQLVVSPRNTTGCSRLALIRLVDLCPTINRAIGPRWFRWRAIAGAFGGS